MNASSTDFGEIVAAVGVAGVALLAIRGQLRLLGRARRDLSIYELLLVGAAFRAVIIIALVLSPDLGSGIRGSDEPAFLDLTLRLAALPVNDGEWIRSLDGNGTVLPWALVAKVLGTTSPLPLRALQASLELAGIAFLAAAVYDLAGSGAARLFAAIAVLEPSGAFFSTLLHDESIIVLGEGLVVFGLAGLWRSSPWAQPTAFLVLGLGLITSARPYLGAATVAGVVLGGVFLLTDRRARRVHAGVATAVVAGVLLVVGVGLAPRVASGTLANLQRQHEVVYEQQNLDLPAANVSTSSGLAETLLTRPIDLLTRPYPWQLGNLSQRLAAIGTVLWYALAALVIVMAARGRRRPEVQITIAMLLPLAVCQAAAYSLTLVNAALGFRHRMHLVLFAAIVVAVTTRLRSTD